MRMRRRLDELLRKLMTPKYYEAGTVFIADTNTTATATLSQAATLVVLTGLENTFVGTPNGTDCIATLTISGSTVTATRQTSQGDLSVAFLAFNP